MQQDLRTKCVMNPFPKEAQEVPPNPQGHAYVVSQLGSPQPVGAAPAPISSIAPTSFWKTSDYLNSGNCFSSLFFFSFLSPNHLCPRSHSRAYSLKQSSPTHTQISLRFP